MITGLCGTGDISHAFMQAASKLLQIEVKAVYHREIKKAESFSCEYGIEGSYDDYGRMLKDIDVVYIGLPNSLHYPYVKEALQNKKHVIVEKPICANHKQFSHLRKLADENNVMMIEMSRVMFLPHFKEISNIVQKESGKILINMNFCKRSRRYDDYLKGLNPNVFTTEFSGGALYDLGVYPLHFAIGIFGKPQNARYHCHKLDSGVDGAGVIVLKYDHCIVTITISKFSDGSSDMLIQSENLRIVSQTAVSLLNELTINGLPVQEQQDSTMFYALQEITSIIMNNKTKEYQALLNQSECVLGVMEELRRQNQIVFKEDIDLI